MEQTTKYVGVDGGEYLLHFGILGMKWGVRRFQNPDGTLTEAGRRRYAKDFGKEYYKNLGSDNTAAYKSGADYLNRMSNASNNARLVKDEDVKKAERDYYDAEDRKRALDIELSNEALRRFAKDRGREADVHNVDDLEDLWNKYENDIASERWNEIDKAETDAEAANKKFLEERKRYYGALDTAISELTYGNKLSRSALYNVMSHVVYENGQWVVK